MKEESRWAPVVTTARASVMFEASQDFLILLSFSMVLVVAILFEHDVATDMCFLHETFMCLEWSSSTSASRTYLYSRTT